VKDDEEAGLEIGLRTIEVSTDGIEREAGKEGKTLEVEGGEEKDVVENAGITVAVVALAFRLVGAATRPIATDRLGGAMATS
jgi:hypothetical protein